MHRKEYFQIPFQKITRDDIRTLAEFTCLTDEELSDDIMEYIARKMGSALVCEFWWEVLAECVRQCIC